MLGVDLFKDFVTGRINYAIASYVDQCYTYMHAANAKEPYNHAEYTRFEHMLKAALLLLTNGDEPFAEAFFHFLIEDGGSVMALTARMRNGMETRNDFCYNAHTMLHEDWYAALPFAVEWSGLDSLGQPYTDTERFSTAQEASDAIKALADNGIAGALVVV